MKRQLAVGLMAVVMGMGLRCEAAEPKLPVCRNAFTEPDEQKQGNEVAAKVYGAMPVLKDSDPIAVYVRGLGAKLVNFAPGYPWEYNFHVVASDEINAFALPGGSIFVNLATIQAAESEAQLAGVMGHEISHVVMRHSTCNITKQQKRSVWFGLAQIAAAVSLGDAGSAVAQGIGYGAGLTFLKMGRDAEKQADLMGTHILYDAGYDPRGMPQFFEIIQAKYGEGGAQMLSDHPNPGNRTEYVTAEIQTLPPREKPVRTTEEFKRVHELAMKAKALKAEEVKAGAWKKSGEYEKGPSGKMD